MVVTCVAFTRSLPATRPLRELPIEAAATAHLDPRYLAGGRIRTGRLPEVVVDFRGRPIPLVARALHHRRVDLVDLVIEIEDAEAAAYLATFERTAGAVSAELFRRNDDRVGVAALHDLLATDLLGHRSEHEVTTGFHRVVFQRGLDAPDGAVPGIVPGHRLRASDDGLEVHADTTVLGDERLGYEMVAGLCARSGLLIDAITDTIDRLAIAAAGPGADLHAILDEAAETQRRAVVIRREVGAHRLLSPVLAPVHEVVDTTMGIGPEGRRDLERSMAALTQLIDSLFARSLEHRLRRWQAGATVALVLLAVLAVAVVVQLLR